jgi:putative ABC transport system permease protein
MNGLFQDLRYALRQLRRSAGFTAVAVLILALGIAANTVIFSVVNSVLLRPLPYKDSGRIIQIWNSYPPRGLIELPISEPEFLEFRQSKSFDHMGAYVTGAVNLTRAGDPERVTATWASAEVFGATGTETILGRVYGPEDDQPGHNQVVVLSYRLWQNHFASDAAIIGKSVTINHEPKTVIGIMGPGFKFPADEVDVWAPLAMNPASKNLFVHYLNVVAHLSPGVTLERARADMKVIYARILKAYPDYYETAPELTAGLIPLQQQIVGNTRPALLVLMGGVAFMLLICCANVANLLLARATTRKKEVATRLAVGASRIRILHQLLTESILLSSLGGTLGVVVAFWGVKALAAGSHFVFPRMHEVDLDLRVLLFTLLTSLLTGMLFGLAPALQASQPDFNDALKEGRSLTGNKAQNRTRNGLIIGEIALSLVLLTGAGLMIGSFVRLLEVRLGFDPGKVLTMQLSLPQSQYPESRQAISFYRELTHRIGTLPGVQSAAVVNHLPMTEQNASASFEVEDRTLDPTSANADFQVISTDYFRAMRISVRQGRAFTDADVQRADSAIVNQTMARKFWPGENVIGKRFKLKADARWLTIVGVVADVKNHGVSTDTKPEMYFPHTDQPVGLWADLRSMTVVVRSSADPRLLSNAVREVIRNLDGDLPVFKIQTLEHIVADSISQSRFTMALLSLFGGFALILAEVGVYGVMSYAVALRTHEMGIRKALGATSENIVGLFIKQGSTLALAGVGVGLAGAFALTRLMSKLLYGISATDPVIIGGMSLLLIAATLLACYLAGRRAGGVDPMMALRE